MIGSDAIEALTPSVKCPICGKRNKPETTFECRKCGREHICISHQDAESYWCRDCILEALQAEMAHIRATFRRAGADRITAIFAPRLEMKFCRIPAGEFLYGAGKERRRTEEFWIGRAPVTTAHFLTFIRETGYQIADTYFASNVARQQLYHPAKCVSWDDAQAWCAWASGKTKAEIYLPSEVEWEKAARGTDGREYPWGSTEPTSRHANFDKREAYWKARGEENWKFTTAVGQFSPVGDSPYGLVDAAGNVSEWCAGWYDAEQKYRVLRGGFFGNGAWLVRCASRDMPDLMDRKGNLGFRVILRPPSFG